MKDLINSDIALYLTWIKLSPPSDLLLNSVIKSGLMSKSSYIHDFANEEIFEMSACLRSTELHLNHNFEKPTILVNFYDFDIDS